MSDHADLVGMGKLHTMLKSEYDALVAERDAVLGYVEEQDRHALTLEARVTELEAAQSEAIYAMEQADYTALGCNEAMRVLVAALAKEEKP